MPTIKGGFSTKDPKAFDKLKEAMGSEGTAGLPFKATGWKSDKLSELVEEEKVVKKKAKKVKFHG